MLPLLLFFLGLGYIMAASLPFSILNRLRVMNGRDPPALPKTAKATHGTQDDGYFQPTPIDVVVTRIMMTRGLLLPPDVVDSIFDHAQYWARSSNEVDFKLEHQSPLRIMGRSRMEDRFIVPLPCLL